MKEVKNVPDKTFHYWNKNIINNNDVDIFMHSFSFDKKNDLLRYKPKKYIIEKQKKFNEIKNIDDLNTVNVDGEKKSIFYKNMDWYQIMYCITYGIKKTVELMTEYEQEHNFIYDLVILSRMDIIWLRPIIFKNLNNNLFYSGVWGKDNYYSKKHNGLIGLWFISNSNFIKQYSTLYENLKKYLLDGIERSYHTISKFHVTTFTKNIEYKFNNFDNNIIHFGLQRNLYKQRILF